MSGGESLWRVVYSVGDPAAHRGHSVQLVAWYVAHLPETVLMVHRRRAPFAVVYTLEGAALEGEAPPWAYSVEDGLTRSRGYEVMPLEGGQPCALYGTARLSYCVGCRQHERMVYSTARGDLCWLCIRESSPAVAAGETPYMEAVRAALEDDGSCHGGPGAPRPHAAAQALYGVAALDWCRACDADPAFVYSTVYGKLCIECIALIGVHGTTAPSA